MSLHARIGHTVVWLSDTPYGCLLPRESSSSFYPHFGQRTGATRVSNWYSPNKRELKVPTFTCLHFHFHFSLQLTTTNRIKFSLSCLFPCTTLHFFTISQRIGTVCPFECAALTGLLPQNHHRPFTLILGSTRVQNGHQTAWPLLQYPLSLFHQRTGSVCRLKNDILPTFWARHGYKSSQ